MGMSNHAYIAPADYADRVDLLEAVAVTEVPANRFREGMVLVDEFDCPVGILDHRMPLERSRRTAGAVKWMFVDLEHGGWDVASFGKNKTFRVVAR